MTHGDVTIMEHKIMLTGMTQAEAVEILDILKTHFYREYHWGRSEPTNMKMKVQVRRPFMSTFAWDPIDPDQLIERTRGK